MKKGGRQVNRAVNSEKNGGRQAHQVANSEKNDLQSMQTTQSPEKWVYIDSYGGYTVADKQNEQ